MSHEWFQISNMMMQIIETAMRRPDMTEDLVRHSRVFRRRDDERSIWGFFTLEGTSMLYRIVTPDGGVGAWMANEAEAKIAELSQMPDIWRSETQEELRRRFDPSRAREFDAQLADIFVRVRGQIPSETA